MRRSLTLAAVLLFAVPALAQDKPLEGDAKKLQGKWTTKGPDGSPLTFAFDKDKFAIKLISINGEESTIEGGFTIDEKAAAKQLGESGRPVLEAAVSALEGLGGWDTAGIEQVLKTALTDPDAGLGLKPRNAFGPVRVAVTGSTVSPPLFESLELLGREVSLQRLRAAQA